MPWHVRDVRPRCGRWEEGDGDSVGADDEPPMCVSSMDCQQEAEDGVGAAADVPEPAERAGQTMDESVPLRRSARWRKTPPSCHCLSAIVPLSVTMIRDALS